VSQPKDEQNLDREGGQQDSSGSFSHRYAKTWAEAREGTKKSRTAKYGFFCDPKGGRGLLYAHHLKVEDQGGSPGDGSIIVVPIAQVGRDEQTDLVPDLHGQKAFPETCGQTGIRAVVHGHGPIAALFLPGHRSE